MKVEEVESSGQQDELKDEVVIMDDTD
jgi:hypothetical protein